MILLDNPIAQILCNKLDHCPSVNWVMSSTYCDDWYTSNNYGIRIATDFVTQDDIVCNMVDVDLTTGKVYYSSGSANKLPKDVRHIIKWYQSEINGGNIMSKKEINEAIRNDIQKLANDLTKKREMDKADSSAEDIAKKLGVKLPKSTK